MQHARLLCPLLPPRGCSNSCPLSWWCYLTISSSASLFSFCLQSLPASESFPMSQLFATLRDYSPTDFSVCGILQQGYWSGLPVPTPGDLPELEIESTSLEFPALGGRFFTTDATWLILFLIFLGIVLLFSTAIVLLYLPTNIVQGVQFLHILTNKLFFYSLHLSVCEMHPIMILICIITNN